MHNVRSDQARVGRIKALYMGFAYW